MSAGRAREVTLLGIAGTAIAGLTWSTVGLGLPALVVGGLNGVIGGAQSIGDFANQIVEALALG